MGVVYLAEDPLIGRQVAIKGIRFDPYAADDEDRSLQRRFEQEIQIAGTFSHPNIVTLFDVGRQSGSSFIAMEYVDGRDLRAELQATGPMSAERAVRMTVPLCRALSYAHERKVIHRDVKPTNILVSFDGVPKITDFGVARLFGSTLTNTGKIFGTPAYMSPEQAVGGKLTGASDQFAIAAVIYELLTGERPFKGTAPTAVIYEVIEHHPPPPHEVAPLVPTPVSAAVMRALDKDAAERFESCDAFADALKDALAWSKANPELAYLETSGGHEVVTPEVTHRDWGPQVARLRRRARQLVAAAAASELGDKVRAAASNIAERPPSSATLAGGAIGLAALLTVVTWAASGSGPVSQPAPPAVEDPGMLVAAAPAGAIAPANAGGEDRGSNGSELEAQANESGENRGSDGSDLEAPAEPSLTPQIDPDPATTPAPTYSFVVSSRPRGAQVLLDGELIGEASPVTIQVEPDARYTLRLELDGYQPLTWGFSLAQLTPTHMESGELHFPLQAIAADTAEEQLTATAGAWTPDLGTPAATGEQADRAASSADTRGGPPPSPGTVRRLRAPAQAPTPEKLRHVDPTLPTGAPLGGVVVLEIEVSARGNVVQAKVLRGLDPVSNQAALDAVVRWKYEPTAVAGTPVHVLLTVTVPISRS
jgi:TonB family protein